MTPSHAVVVITYRRPEHLRECLTALAASVRRPDRVVVVDQSPDDASRDVVSAFPNAEWVDNRANAGRMTSSRNVGIEHVARTSDIISFIDDDSLVAPDWSVELVEAFGRHPTAGAVGGRVDNGNPAEGEIPGAVGTISRGGRVTGNFAAVRAADIEVEHVLGANMSFRRDVLLELGGFREDYPGTAMGEDTDMSLRVGALGHRLFFAPRAVVRHTSAPHVHGTRFDLRYAHYAASNYVLLMRRNYGFMSTELWGQLVEPLRVWREDRSLLGRVARTVVGYAGLIRGVLMILRRDRFRRTPLRRDDAAAARIRQRGP